MPEVNIRNLKAQLSKFLREVREKRARYLVTYHGRPIAALVPLEETIEQDLTPGRDPGWTRLAELGEQIGRAWTSDKTTVETLTEIRR